MPRMTTAQITAIASPATGLMVYDNVLNQFKYFDGTAWTAIGTWAGGLASGVAAGNTPYWNGTTWITNTSKIYNNGGNIGIGTTAPVKFRYFRAKFYHKRRANPPYD